MISMIRTTSIAPARMYDAITWKPLEERGGEVRLDVGDVDVGGECVAGHDGAPCSVGLLQGEAEAGHERFWIYGSSGLLNFEVQMAAERPAGVAFGAERGAGRDVLTGGDAKRAPLHVAVEGDESIAVVDPDSVSVAVRTNQR